MGTAQRIVVLAVVAAGCDQVVPFKAESDFRAPDYDLPDPEPTTTDERPSGWSSAYRGMVGTIRYDASVNGATGCDTRIDLTGHAYEGGCPDCTFAFDVDAEVVSSGGSADCPLVPAWTMLSDGVTINPKLGFSPTYTGFEEVLWFGYGLDLRDEGYDLLEGPVWSMIHYDGFSGELSWDAESLAWDSALEFAYGYGASPLIDYECVADVSNPGDPVVGGAEVVGTLSTDERHMDVYDVSATAGAALAVAVDTTTAEQAFQPLLVVAGPDGCIVAANYSAFACTHPPPQGQWCAGTEFVAPQTGTYRIAVFKFAGIQSASSTGAYALAVSGADGAPALVADGDDALMWAEWRELQIRTEMDLMLEW